MTKLLVLLLAVKGPGLWLFCGFFVCSFLCFCTGPGTRPPTYSPPPPPPHFNPSSVLIGREMRSVAAIWPSDCRTSCQCTCRARPSGTTPRSARPTVTSSSCPPAGSRHRTALRAARAPGRSASSSTPSGPQRTCPGNVSSTDPTRTSSDTAGCEWGEGTILRGKPAVRKPLASQSAAVARRDPGGGGGRAGPCVSEESATHSTLLWTAWPLLTIGI